MGQAIFSNFPALLYGKAGQKYDRAVKEFRIELKKQKINAICQTGILKNFLESDIITKKEIQRIFRFTFDIENFLYADITMFTWG